jgi:hypothetical protein
MNLLCVIGVCLTVGQGHQTPQVTALPALKPYTQTQIDAINAERAKVKECCPLTDGAMVDYGKLRDKLKARGK